MSVFHFLRFRIAFCGLLLSILGQVFLGSAPATITGAAPAGPVFTSVPLGLGGIGPVAVAVNPVTNRVFIANRFSGNVTVLDANTSQVVKTIPVGDSPQSLAVNPFTNRIYVTHSANGTITILDGASLRLAGSIQLNATIGKLALNPTTNRGYVVNPATNRVTVFEGNGNQVIASIKVGKNPTNVTVNPVTNRIYVTNTGNIKKPGRTISVIDGNTNSVQTIIQVETNPVELVVNPASNRLYVASAEAGYLSVIDGLTNLVLGQIQTGQPILGMAFNPNTNQIFAGGPSLFSIIDGRTNQVTASFSLPKEGPLAIGVLPASNQIFVTHYFSHALSVIDGNGKQGISTIDLGLEPVAIGVNPQTNRIYLGNGNQTMLVLDGMTNLPLATIPTGNGVITGLAVNSVTNRIYGLAASQESILVVDGDSNQILTKFVAGAAPQAIEVNSATNRIFITHKLSHTVSVIDGANHLVLTEIKVGKNPSSLACNPSTNRIYVLNEDKTMSVIDGTTNQVIKTIATGTVPFSIGINSDTNRVYVGVDSPITGGNLNNGVLVVDGRTNTVAATIKIPVPMETGGGGVVTIGEPGLPVFCRVNPQTNRVFVAQVKGKKFSIVDGSTNQILSTFVWDTFSDGITINPRTSRVYWLNRLQDTLTLIVDAP